MQEQMSLKEEFVFNLNGTTIDEIFVLASSPPLLTVLSQLLTSLVAPHNTFIRVVIELVVRGVGMVTMQSGFGFDSLKFFIIPLLVIFTLILSTTRRHANQIPADGKRIWALSEYRSSMMLGTVVAILAVDFQLFPRRFAKTEVSGISLMDLGVGSFVFAAGVVSPMARGAEQKSFGFDIKLFFLGFIRFFTVWFSGYQSHVSEYGVHWNFFLTLFLLPLIPTFKNNRLLQYLTSPYLILIVHNVIVLYLSNGVTYTMHAPRVAGNFFSQNREGILSLFGYICLYKIGIDLGRFIFTYASNGSKEGRRKLFKFYLTLLLVSVPAMLLCEYFNKYLSFGSESASDRTSIGGILVPSRRICNAGYVFLTVAYNMFLISLYGIIEHLTITPQPLNKDKQESANNLSKVVAGTDLNGLFIFLISNLGTGAVNLIMGERTVTSSITTGFIVVSLYTSIVLSVALVLLYAKRRIF